MTPTEARDYLTAALQARGEYGLACLVHDMHGELTETAAGVARDAEQSAARVEDFWERRITSGGSAWHVWDARREKWVVCASRDAAERTLVGED